MGWNSIAKQHDSPFLEGIADGEYVYFVHSYYAVPRDGALIATTTPYGNNFASSIATDHLFACQFHPEKSQKAGLRILANFARFAEKG
jgi:glutamine amidotransferase